jgi:hypothetical protein
MGLINKEMCVYVCDKEQTYFLRKSKKYRA